MRKRDKIDLILIALWFTFWASICIMALASCCQPRIIEQRGGIYRVKYMGKTYVTDNPKTIKKDL
jgi:hypothetical protein